MKPAHFLRAGCATTTAPLEAPAHRQCRPTPDQRSTRKPPRPSRLLRRTLHGQGYPRGQTLRRPPPVARPPTQQARPAGAPADDSHRRRLPSVLRIGSRRETATPPSTPAQGQFLGAGGRAQTVRIGRLCHVEIFYGIAPAPPADLVPRPLESAAGGNALQPQTASVDDFEDLPDAECLVRVCCRRPDFLRIGGKVFAGIQTGETAIDRSRYTPRRPF